MFCDEIEKCHPREICRDLNAEHAYFAEDNLIIVSPTQTQKRYASFVWSRCPHSVTHRKITTPLGQMNIVDYYLFTSSEKSLHEEHEVWQRMYVRYIKKLRSHIQLQRMQKEHEQQKKHR